MPLAKLCSTSSLQQVRRTLPVFNYRDEILKLVRYHQVVIVSGETGSGKTTQIPQYILEDGTETGNGSSTRIVVTQPGRISAISVAQRVARERGEDLKSSKQGSIGFQVRHEKCLPRKDESILYCTTGILLKKLKGDPLLFDFSHVIVDEVHQRDLDSDFLLTVLKDILQTRPFLKVILMSASMDEIALRNYFPASPLVKIPGRTFSVEEFYLENVLDLVKIELKLKANSDQGMDPLYQKLYNQTRIRELAALENNDTNLMLVSALVQHIHKTVADKTKGILVFLSGWSELKKVGDLLKDEFKVTEAKIHFLHSLVGLRDQRAVFGKPRSGLRKIILSTNLAETSVTIEDVVYVVDSGKMKLSNFNVVKNEKSLNSEWISTSSAKQRAGRAGRVRNGVCYHLYSRAKAESLDPFVIPEILRSPLEETILQIKKLELGNVREFLRTTISPPKEMSIRTAFKLLIGINALNPHEPEELMPLGHLLASLPIHPVLGKMIVLGSIFSCLDPTLSLACILYHPSMFLLDRPRLDSDQYFFGEKNSDHLMRVKILKRWELALASGEELDFCEENFLNSKTLSAIYRDKCQILDILQSCGLVSESSSNLNGKNENLFLGVIAASLYPNVAKVGSPKGRTLTTLSTKKLPIHKKSVVKFSEDEWAVYYNRMSINNSSVINDVTLISNIAPVLLFGGTLSYRTNKRKREIISVDELVTITVPKSFGSVIKEARSLLDDYLNEKLVDPWLTDWDNPEDIEVQFLDHVISLMEQ